MNKKLTAAATAGLLVASGGFMSQAMAEQGFSYDYVEGGIGLQDGFGEDLVGPFVNGSMSFDEMFAVVNFSYLTDDTDLMNFSAGTGYRFGITPELDVYGTFTVEYTDLEQEISITDPLTGETHTATYEDDDFGFGIAGGARYALTNDMELAGELKFLDTIDDRLDLTISYLYGVTPEIDVLAEAKIMDFADEDEFGSYLGARYHF
ncbi:outer membrane beta-barrel protein [Halorhodospira halochloris]|uniref:outer membrane beta-barrel protein n=1 Tax=Halorhodospira halochloris TaxID=1052 RepID=UPI001EE8FCD7|nr:outer membrane beta-barrel protein [Halorhodospira halochloris]MCG5548425.1 porin family protein [Halorhodospira halochloris]